MKILVLGASGFVGQALVARLRQAGHSIVRGLRSPISPDDIQVDFARDIQVDDWLPKLQGIDAVVNAVGIIIERKGQSFEALHQKAPQALFAACVKTGVKRVLQISALGAEQGETPYFKTKRAADEFLMAQPLEWQILRPSIIYGTDGASAKMFRTLACLPVVFLPGGGVQRFQPVHVDDVAAAADRLLDPATPAGQCIAALGSQEIQYRDMLRIYRAAMGFSKAWAIPVPAPLISITAKIADYIPGALLTSDNWKMLQNGSFGDPAPFANLLGHSPRPVEQFISAQEAPILRANALQELSKVMFRASLAFILIITVLIILLNNLVFR